MSGVTAIYIARAGRSTLSDNGWRPNPLGGPVGPPSMSLTKVVGAPGFSTVPPRGPTIDIFDKGGERSQISSRASQGAAIDIFDKGGGLSRISGSTPRGPAIDIFDIGGECSWISNSTP
jgi:hypothetical protein